MCEKFSGQRFIFYTNNIPLKLDIVVSQIKSKGMFLFRRKPPPPRSVLFVCTANVTRSPVAEIMFRQLAGRTGEVWKVASAGVKGARGMGVNQVIGFIMFQRKLSLQHHRAQPVTRKLLAQYQWIVVMEERHRQSILELDDNLKDRVFLFRELANSEPLTNPNMPDPTGKDVDDYRELFGIFDAEMPVLVKAIRDKAYELEMGDSDDN
jgi:protein-tyrosine phosphatase